MRARCAGRSSHQPGRDKSVDDGRHQRCDAVRYGFRRTHMVGVSGCERGRGKVCGHAGGSTAADHYRAPLVERMGKLRANVESAKLSEMLRGAAMQSENPTAKEESQSKPYQVRLPGFVVDE